MPRRALKILILEDDALTAAAFAAVLEDKGHEVVAVAETAREGISRAGGNAPGSSAGSNGRRSDVDLALVDLGLRDGRTGLDAASVLAERFSIPVILISGEPDLAAKARAVRALAWIAKPADADHVARIVDGLAMARDRRTEIRTAETPLAGAYAGTSMGVAEQLRE